jgi:UDP-N-acetylmuramoyl-L-alanyl-D-glutamate--2,6-diaminopimelate ligase
MNEITTSFLANEVNGHLIGPEKLITGIFTFLNQAKAGDVVVRHWIDEKGIEIAAKKGV